MPEANSLQSEKDKILREMTNLDGGDDEYKVRLNNLSCIQKLEQEADKNRIEKEKLEIEKEKLEVENKEPTLFEKVMDGVKAIGPAVITGVFSLAALHHITKNEKEEGLYYGTKGMSFIKKP